MFLLYGLLTVLSILILTYFTKDKKKLPPGPTGLPIIGNLLSIDPKVPHESLSTLAWKYGPVCGIRMGSVYTVLLSDPKLIRHVFSKDTFSGRAPLYLTHGIMKGYGLIAAEGEMWKEQRKFVATSLKNFGMIKFANVKRDQMEQKINEVVDEALQKLEVRSKENVGLNPNKTLHHCLGNLMNYLVFGKVFDEDDEVWRWLQLIQEEGLKHIGVSGPLNFLPFLRFIPYYANVLKLISDGQVKTHEIYRKILEDHRKCPVEMDNFLAAYDEEIKRRQESGEPLGSFTDTQLFYLLADLHGAGVDTTLTTLHWFLLYMTAHPEEQIKIQTDIDDVVRNKEPTLEDRSALIRLEAAIMEVQRLRSIVPIGIPHGTTEDTKIEAYDIPKGSMIVPLQWAIHMNPLLWPNPNVFNPDRFIEKEGNLTRPDVFLPFQYGKRMCVGDELARMILFLFGARILHRFSLLSPPGQTINLEGDCGITLVPKPQNIIFKRRH